MRWILGSIAGGVSVVLLAGSAVLLVPADKIAQIAAQQIEAETGRRVTLHGPISPRLWSGVGIDTGAISIANAGWVGDGPMIDAANLRITVPLSALWGGDLRIASLDLQRPTIRLERRTDGEANWQITPERPSDLANQAAPSLWPQIEAKITDGVVILTDHQRGFSRSIERVTAQLSLPAPGGPAKAALRGRMNGLPISLTAETAALDQSPRAAPVTARFAAVAGRARVDFEGDIALAPLRVDGALHMDLADTEALSRLTQTQIAPWPAGMGAKKLRLDGRMLVQSSGTVTLRDMVLAADDNHLRLSATLTELDAKPRIDATISAETPVKLWPATADRAALDAETTTTPESPLWSEHRIDLSALQLFDGLVYLYAPSIQVGAVQTDAMRGQLAVSQGQATLSITELAAYEGSATAKVVINSQGRGSASGDIEVNDLAVGPLLRDIGQSDLLEARLNGQASLLTSLASVNAMVHHLQGDGRLELTKGVLQGIDLAALLNSRDLSYHGEGQTTLFDAVDTDFSIADGVLRADHLTLQTADMQASGSGVIGLGGRMIDYRLMPNPSLAHDRIRMPLAVSGPWVAPNLSLDWQAMIDPKIAAEDARAALLQNREDAAETAPQIDKDRTDAANRERGAEVLRNLDRLMGGH